jgi:hypothetical protein
MYKGDTIQELVAAVDAIRDAAPAMRSSKSSQTHRTLEVVTTTEPAILKRT